MRCTLLIISDMKFNLIDNIDLFSRIINIIECMIIYYRISTNEYYNIMIVLTSFSFIVTIQYNNY